MIRKLTKTNISLIVLCIVIIMLFIPKTKIAYASGLADGVYDVTFETELNSMGMMAFENGKKNVLVEKIGDNYYMTVSFDSSTVKDVELIGVDKKVGETIKQDGTIEKHTYTLSSENINKDLNFSVFIKEPMNKTKEFTIKAILSTAKKIGDVDISFDRPAEYVPEIQVNASNSEQEKGSTYIIPTATAKLGGINLEVKTTAYYKKNGIKTDIDVKSGRLLLSNVGEYHIVYMAESDNYKTLNGNNTSSKVDIKIMSKVGAKSIAKVDKQTVLEGTQIQASFVSSGDIYSKATNAIKDYSDHYDIINVNLFSASGEAVTLGDKIPLYLLVNEAFNRNDIEVYLLNEDGTKVKLEAEGYGRYVKVLTDKVGTFIICRPGVEFTMPMYGYALITVFVVILLAFAIVVPIVVVKNKKKKINLVKCRNHIKQ